MLKKDAQKLIGTHVSCRTSLNGCYIGELLEVYGSPWRGKVKILEVTEYPVQGLSNSGPGIYYRKPFKFGDVKDFGNSSIDPYHEVIRTYDVSLIDTLKRDIEKMEKYHDKGRLIMAWIDEMKRVLAELSEETPPCIRKAAER